MKRNALSNMTQSNVEMIRATVIDKVSVFGVTYDFNTGCNTMSPPIF
jgi:hypothetical protein